MKGTPQTVPTIQATTAAIHRPADQASAPEAAQATAEAVPGEDSAEAVQAEAADHQAEEDRNHTKQLLK